MQGKRAKWSPDKQKKMAEHRLKMAERQNERANRKAGLRQRGTGIFYPRPPVEVKQFPASIPGGRRRKALKT